MAENLETDKENTTVGFQQDTSSMANPGIVYILSNDAMPNYLKIGKTAGDSVQHVRERMKGLDGTNLPLPFYCEYAALVENYDKVERALHTAFSSFRVPRNREFFKDLQPLQAQAFLELIAISVVTPDPSQPEGGDFLLTSSSSSGRFNFSMVNIPVGAELEWYQNSDIKCVVADGNTKVEFEDVQYSISGLAKFIKQTSYALNGTLYWNYQGERLQDLRDRLHRDNQENDLEST